MKTPSVVKSVQDATCEVTNRTQEGLSTETSETVQCNWLVRKLAWLGTAAAAMLVGKLLLQWYCKLKGMREETARLQHEDEKLDSALEDTMDASDAVAKY